ncbi:MAG: cob(I)yrinic acid a,c-diamide adenosyltransferase [Thermoplasmata archaeon]|nr:cob(I)yrinic acid a,c-diamide adenosyltransferase [Thermoplasmata archaeon]
MPDPGMVQVYTGNGKGKTTAAVGLAARALGRGLSVLVVQFMKGGVEYGEVASLRRLGAEVHQFGSPDFVDPHSPSPADSRMAAEAIQFALRKMYSGRYDVVILDEVNVAAAWGLIPVGDVLAVITDRPKHVELVLTGRYAPPEILEAADLVTEMREVKHYFRRGEAARDGIER